jgi:hypothetical protein
MRFRTALMVLSLAVPASVALADAPSLSDPDSLPKISCTQFTYSSAFLHKYPKAPAGCLEGRVFKGHKYAKFNAKVYLIGPDFTTVQLLNVAGDTTSTFSFKAPAGAQVVVNGKPEPIEQLKEGDQITFWVPQGRMSAQSLPGPTNAAWRVMPPQPATK